jgi:putative peptide maturation dehydrogenase
MKAVSMPGRSDLRRCCAVFVEPNEVVGFDIGALLGGRDPRSRAQRWTALAPHLDAPVDLDEQSVAALGRLSETQWTAHATVAAAIPEPALQALVDAGLILERGNLTAAHRRDIALRDANWHPLLATAHAFSRWSKVDSLEAQEASGIHSTADLIAASGLPPPHYRSREDALARVPLGRAGARALDSLMERRTTCRNFDTNVPLSARTLALVLHRTFGEQGREEIEPGAVALKKNHPSGGGLHPLEAYVVVQRVDGVDSGLYHYNVESHALDRLPESSALDLAAFAREMVAGQHYFSDAAVLLVIAARFPRSSWKYRKHPKIYRAILIEAGHVSQNLYLTATELGLGAYVTAAINEVEIEQAFGLDALLEGPIAVCGFGPRARRLETIELDPAHRVWDERGDLLAADSAENINRG